MFSTSRAGMLGSAQPEGILYQQGRQVLCRQFLVWNHSFWHICIMPGIIELCMGSIQALLLFLLLCSQSTTDSHMNHEFPALHRLENFLFCRQFTQHGTAKGVGDCQCRTYIQGIYFVLFTRIQNTVIAVMVLLCLKFQQIPNYQEPSALHRLEKVFLFCSWGALLPHSQHGTAKGVQDCQCRTFKHARYLFCVIYKNEKYCYCCYYVIVFQKTAGSHITWNS